MDSARGNTAGGGEVRGMGKLVTGGEMPPSSNKAGSGGETRQNKHHSPRVWTSQPSPRPGRLGSLRPAWPPAGCPRSPLPVCTALPLGTNLLQGGAVEALDLVAQLFAQTQAPAGTPSHLEGVSQKLGAGGRRHRWAVPQRAVLLEP